MKHRAMFVVIVFAILLIAASSFSSLGACEKCKAMAGGPNGFEFCRPIRLWDVGVTDCNDSDPWNCAELGAPCGIGLYY